MKLARFTECHIKTEDQGKTICALLAGDCRAWTVSREAYVLLLLQQLNGIHSYSQATS